MKLRTLSQKEFAAKINGPSLEREIDRLAALGAEGIELARVLSRRVNSTVDWVDLGDESATWNVHASRGEAVVFFDTASDPSVVLKLRGLEQNGFPGGFGCILGFNERGKIDLLPCTIEQAIEREKLSWEELGFGCEPYAVIGDEVGLLLSQRFIVGESPTLAEIDTTMRAQGWEDASDDRELELRTRQNAWKREGLLAVDANQTNLIRAAADGQVYAIDVIIWQDPRV